MREGNVFGNAWTESCLSVGGKLVPPYILGDAAYPLYPWLIKGFPNARCARKKNFNYVLSSNRMSGTSVWPFEKSIPFAS